MTVGPHPFRDRVAVVGVGYTPMTRGSGMTTTALAVQAVQAAVADAGLELHQIGGPGLLGPVGVAPLGEEGLERGPVR